MWVKLCGVRAPDRARKLAELGPNALGINRYEPSSRYVDRERAERLAGVVREVDPSIDVVGVYVNSSSERLRKDYEAIEWDVIQLHGDESPEEVQNAGQLTRTMKAFQVDEDFSMDRLETYDSWAYLLDAYHPERYGGTGETAPWERIRFYTDHHRIVLAGGLDPENVREAIRSVNPWGVDACSGIEDDPGNKDPEKSARFVERARSMQETSSTQE
jgi:phosphoribosylanthranilate isomerase